MTNRSVALANDPIVEEAATDYLLAGGSALGAVLCGFFAAAGGHAGVLLGPVSILVAGAGVGARAFDGRLRQPGLGTKRPRGFQDGETIPDAARIAVPAGVSAALVALAYDGTQKLGSVIKPGVQRAQRGNAPERASLLRRVRAVGATALQEPSFVRALLRDAGPSQGGLLTPSDFVPPTDVDQPAAERPVEGGAVIEVPWAGEDLSLPEGSDIGIGCSVVSVDVRGLFAALCYRRLTDGFVFEEVELEAPLGAFPVQRGIPRRSPGGPLPAPAPMALRRDADGAVVEVLAAPGADRLGDDELANSGLRLHRDAVTRSIGSSRG